MDPTKFDELTKALVTPTSRRVALRRIGGALTGAILASWPFSHTLASNSDCAKFCNAVFGADTPAANQCISDAAHHTGLCYGCGPASGSTKPICCTKTGGFCSSYSGATCCGSGETCLNGSCCANANVCGSTCLAAPCDPTKCQACDPTTGTCVGCPSGQVCLSNGTCCTPTTCAAQGVSCGTISDGCGGTLNCGTCPSGQPCTNGQCVATCIPPGSPCTVDNFMNCCNQCCFFGNNFPNGTCCNF